MKILQHIRLSYGADSKYIMKILYFHLTLIGGGVSYTHEGKMPLNKTAEFYRLSKALSFNDLKIIEPLCKNYKKDGLFPNMKGVS